MTCSDLEPLLQPYVDGEFSTEDALEVERHLGGCESCDERVRRETRERDGLRRHLQASQVSAPASVRASVQAGFVRERRRAKVMQLTRWGSVTLAVAAVSTLSWNHRARPHDVLRMEAALRHARRLPFEVQPASSAQIEAWFDGKLSHPVRLPRLTNATLAGARLSHVSDRDAAYVSYVASPAPGGPSHRVGLFVLQAESDSGPSVLEVIPANGYNVATWQGDGVTYELVTDLDEGDIRRMVAGPAAPAYTIQPVSLPVR